MLRRIVLSILTPIVWRWRPRLAERAMRRFALVEADSGWQALRAAKGQSTPERKAQLICIALEEFDHAERFRSLASSTVHEIEQLSARHSLWDEDPDYSRFLARLHVAEDRVHREFYLYRRAVSLKSAKDIFSSIQIDESRHSYESWRALVAISGGTLEAGRCLDRVKNEMRKEALFRVFAKLGGVVRSLPLIVVYFVFGGLLALLARNHLRQITARGRRP